MAKQCPRCSSEVERFVCPACGLDLQLHEEMRVLQADVRRLISALGVPPPLPGLPSPGQTGERSTGRMADGPPVAPVVNEPASSAPGRGAPDSGRARRGLNEVAVGQRWFLALGVIVILLGAGFFLKYAFDEQWIGPPVQITLGFGGGLGCLGLGRFLRRRRAGGLDGGLAALGLGLLYLSAYAGSQIYDLLPDYLSLTLALIIAAFGIVLANAWDSLFLAVLTFLGGYLAPMVLVAERFGHWLFFLYVAVLNVASQILAYQRRWPLLYAFGASCSWICLGIWALNHDQRERFVETFTFTQFLFFLYSVAPFARALVRADTEKPQGFWLSMANGLLCVWNSSYLLDFQKFPVSLVAAAYAAVALGLALWFWRERRPGLAVTWLTAEGMIYLLTTWTVALPDRWITVFCAGQAVALYWVAARSRDRVLLVGSIIVAGFADHRLLWSDVGRAWDPILTGHASFTGSLISRWFVAGVTLACLAGVISLDRRRPVPGFEGRVYPWFEVLWLVGLFGFLNLEIDRAATQFLPRAASAAYSLLWAMFGAALLVYGFCARRKPYRLAAIILLFITAAKVLLLDTSEVSAPYRIISCVILGATLVVLSSVYYRYSDRLLRK